MQQVRKATEIISHLRTFGRAAPVSREPILSEAHHRAGAVSYARAASAARDRGHVDLGPDEPFVVGNAIQLEQVFINLLTNARDAVADSPRKAIRISGSAGARRDRARVCRHRTRDSAGPGRPDIRPVLHHQGGRRGHRPRSVDHLRHHQGARRHDLGREPARRRRHVP